MKIELRNIHHHAALSEETYCYDAKLYVDGKHIADVSNRGHGGCDEVHVRKGCEEAFRQAEAWCASQPPIEGFNGMSIPYDLELLCGDQVTDHLLRKDFQRAVKSKVLVAEPNGTVSVWGWKGVRAVEQKHIDAIAKKLTAGQVILNSLPVEQAFLLFKNAK